MAWGLVLCFGPSAWAIDIQGAQPFALDQPRIYGEFRLTQTGDPITAQGTDIFGDPVTVKDVQFFLDTGSSGILLSQETADALGIARSQYNGTDVTFSDVGVAGTEDFGVSNEYYISIANFQSEGIFFPLPPGYVDPIGGSSTGDDSGQIPESSYHHTFGPIRTQMTLTSAGSGLLSEPLDIVGMPVLQGKVVVFDPKPTNELNYMSAYVYDPGTPFHSDTAHTDPGIPNTDHHVRVSQVDFSGFTEVTPTGAAGPTLASNPMIGPNPFDENDTTPPVNITWDGHSASGSFLFDSGAQASFISSAMAEKLHVHVDYVNDGQGNLVPQLLDDNNNPLPNQFTATMGGIGGSVEAAGFYLSSLTLTTEEGDPINYINAPVLVADVSAYDPETDTMFTFDGDFGVNFWVASMDLGGTGDLGGAAISPYSWVTYDVSNNLLGFQLNTTVPEPANALLLLAPFLFMLNCRRRRA